MNNNSTSGPTSISISTSCPITNINISTNIIISGTTGTTNKSTSSTTIASCKTNTIFVKFKGTDLDSNQLENQNQVMGSEVIGYSKCYGGAVTQRFQQ